ncbi:MAG: hypothetical protein LIO90_02525 [Bacteroidales bacterium]|nr:hypothetical protein [Bacteroidales bacterium]
MNAANYTIVVTDDAALASLTINGEEVAVGETLITGTYENYFSATAYAADNFVITSVTNGTQSVGSNYYTNASFYDYNGGDVAFIINTAPASEFYSATATINLTADADSLAMVRFSGSYRQVYLNAGENQIAFAPSIEQNWTLGTSTYGKYFYSVELNDSAITQYTSAYYYLNDMVDGDVLDIVATWPDVDYTVTFDMPAENVIKSVTVDNEEVEWADGVTAKAGSSVSINANTSYYKFNNVVVNGDTLSYFYGYHTIAPLTGDVEMAFDVEAYPLYTVTLNIDDVDNVNVSNIQNIELVSGENVLQLPYNPTGYTNYIEIQAKAGGFEITSCEVNGVEATPQTNWSNEKYYDIDLADSLVIVVKTFAPSRYEEMALYLESLEIGNWPAELTSACGYLYNNFEAGYNSILFDSAIDSPFELNTYAYSATPYVYLNNDQVDPTWTDGYIFEIKAEEFDVVKVYKEQPAEYTVCFHGATNEAEMYMDRIQLVEKFNYVAFQGTEIAILTANEVKVNDETITAESGRMYIVTVNEDVDIEIVAETTGINGIATEAKKMEGVYNMQGVRVSSDLNNLPAGVYIVNGEKRIVR